MLSHLLTLAEAGHESAGATPFIVGAVCLGFLLLLLVGMLAFGAGREHS